MKKKVIPTVVLLLLMSTVPAWSIIQRHALPDFAAYLRDAGLLALYRTELRTLCVEDGDLYACWEYGSLFEREAIREHERALMDSITWKDDRRRVSSDLIRAGLLYRFEEYKEALEALDAIIEELPDKDILVEAVLIRAQCQYHLGQVDDALMGLRSIRPYLPEGRDPDLALYLGLCEEAKGNLSEAEKLIEEAESGGSPDAPSYLLRLKLKEGDLKSFFVIAEEVGSIEGRLSCRDVCDLAREVQVVLPRAWSALMAPVVADSGFTVSAYPEVANSILHLAEAGEDMTYFCDTLLSRAIPRVSADRLRYARAVSVGGAAICDTLVVLARTTPDRDLKARCLLACLTHASGDEGAALAGRLLPSLGSLRGDLSVDERLVLAGMLAEFGQGEMSRDHLTGLLEDLVVGDDDVALLEIAAEIERAGDVERALSLYRVLAESPIPSEHTLKAARSAYLLDRETPPEGDIADVVERVAQEGADPLELGDLFMERLHDVTRAASFYRRALAGLPEGIPADPVNIRLAEALAVGALEADDRDLRSEALSLIEGLADTSIVDAGEIVRVLQVSTDWLETERARTFTVIQALGERDDLSSRDLYRMARLLYHLFSQRDGNVYAQCAMTLRRLAKEYPTSKEAPLGSLLAARLKFLAGDYVGALEVYEACRAVWRNHAVTSLCEEGIGDCYLYSGGIEEAISHYAGAKLSPRIAFKTAECYELSDRLDSALYYYDLGLGELSTPALSDLVRLRRGLLVYERDGLEAALSELDSPFPAIRERLGPLREITAAYALGKAGYRNLGMDILTRVSEGGGDLACGALLLLSDLEPEDEPEHRLALLGDGETSCKSIYGALRLLGERAYLACSSGPLEVCIRERKRYRQRFPLDQRSRFGFEVHQALLLYREGRGETATAIIDSLAGTGRKHDALAYGLYRKGIQCMVDGDYSRGAEAFHRIEREYAGSELHFDTLFKLGTAYYMLESYDSSAVYFEMATRAGDPSLVENAYFNLGLALEEAGRLERASDAFRTLAVRFPFSERFDRSLMRAAYTLEQAGSPEEAIPVYRDLLQYAEAPETAAEALYWIGESFAEMGAPLRAACEFLRVVHLFPGGGPWKGTASFRAGMECERAGLTDHASLIYRENVRTFGTGTDWGRASQDRLNELEKLKAGMQERGGPATKTTGDEPVSDQAPGQGRPTE